MMGITIAKNVTDLKGKELGTNTSHSELEQENLEEAEGNPKEVKGCRAWCSCRMKCCFMLCKALLITIRFVFRLVIIPLLALHWLNDYAWNCIFNHFTREYCATITNEYFIGLDRSLVVYGMYVFIMLAVLLTIIVERFPKGMPKFILELDSLTIKVEDGGKKQRNSTS